MFYRFAVGLCAGLMAAAQAFAAQDLLPPMNGAAGDFAQRRAGAEVSAEWRIGVTGEGLYRISGSTMASRGLTNVIGSELRLFCRTQEVAITTSTDGAFASGDYLLFYGIPHDGYYTTTNVYWLGTGGTGLRMATRACSRLTNGYADVGTFTNLSRQAADRLYRAYYQPTNEAMDHWFAGLLTPTSDTSFTVTCDNLSSTAQARIEVVLYGLTQDALADPDHRTDVKINGTTVTNIFLEGENSFSGSCAFGSTLLTDPSTTVSFRQAHPSATNDRVYVQSFTLAYRKRIEAQSGRIFFDGRPGSNNYYASGFDQTNGTFWALDVTSPFQPVLLTGGDYDTPVAGKRRLIFGDVTTSTRRYAVCQTASVSSAASFERVRFRELASTNREGQYVIICPYEFRNHAYRLLKQRHVQRGLSVAVAPITDLYNEFSYGIKDAAAIKQFLGYAYHHWKTRPVFVLLAGEGSYDPKNQLGITGAADWIPVHLGPTPYDWAPLEGWFGTVNGSDWLVDMAIGRVPAVSESQFGATVDKTMYYETLSATNSWRKKALVVADDRDSAYDPDFAGACDTNIWPYLESMGMVYTPRYLEDSDVGTVRQTISNDISRGCYVVNYFGHGAYDVWATENLFGTNDAVRLTNTVFPVFTMLTCKNGAFEDPTAECLSEVLVERNSRGAVAAVSASALSIEPAAEAFANGFYEAMAHPTQSRTLGGMMNNGMSKLWTSSPGSSELLFYNILGDPALNLKPSP